MMIERRNRRRHTFGMVVVAGFTGLFAAEAAQAGLLSIGSTGSGGLGVGVDLGGVEAGVSVGGSSVASASASVGGSSGVNADATVGGSSLADVDASVGGTSGVNASATVAGTSVANVSATIGAAPGGGTVSIVPEVAALIGMPTTQRPLVPAKLVCAKGGGNTSAFNGYPLTDRGGHLLGVVHAAVLGGGGQIASVSVQGLGGNCLTVKGGGLRLAGYSVRGGFDAAKANMAYR